MCSFLEAAHLIGVCRQCSSHVAHPRKRHLIRHFFEGEPRYAHTTINLRHKGMTDPPLNSRYDFVCAGPKFFLFCSHNLQFFYFVRLSIYFCSIL